MSRYQRWNELLELLPGDGQLTVADAAQALGVSQATIRRDMDQLARQQLVTRTRGGVVAGHVSYDLPLRYKTARHAPQKQRIGRAAAAFLASRPDLEGRTVRLDLIAVRTSRLRARVTHRAGAIEGRERPPSRQGRAQNTG